MTIYFIVKDREITDSYANNESDANKIIQKMKRADAENGESHEYSIKKARANTMKLPKKESQEEREIRELTEILEQHFRPGDIVAVLSHRTEPRNTEEGFNIMKQFLILLEGAAERDKKICSHIAFDYIENGHYLHTLITSAGLEQEIHELWNGGVAISYLASDKSFNEMARCIIKSGFIN